MIFLEDLEKAELWLMTEGYKIDDEDILNVLKDLTDQEISNLKNTKSDGHIE